jgi:hypothetical protein
MSEGETMTITETAQVLSVDNAKVRALVAQGELVVVSENSISKDSVIALVRKYLIGR